MTDTPTPSPPLELLNIADAAKRYPIGNNRLRRLIRDGAIRAVRLQGSRGRARILVRPQAIEEWLLAQESAAPACAAND